MAQIEKRACGSTAARQSSAAEQKWICTQVSASEKEALTSLAAEVLLSKSRKAAELTLKAYDEPTMEKYRNEILPSQYWYGDRVWCAQFEEGLRQKAERDVAAAHKKELEEVRKQTERETRARLMQAQNAQQETTGQIVSRIGNKIAKKVSQFIGADTDSSQAEEWFQKGNIASKSGFYQVAAEWYRKAAEQGHVGAQCRLGDACRKAEDYEASAYWYRKAAKQGNAYAQSVLGGYYERGCGVRQSYASAAEWYRKAAAQGDTKSAADLQRVLKLQGKN